MDDVPRVPQFPSFPLEIRLLIWHFALPDPGRRIDRTNKDFNKQQKAMIPFLLTCKEFHDVFLSVYIHPPDSDEVIVPRIFIDPQTDLLHYRMFPTFKTTIQKPNSHKANQVKRCMVSVDAASGYLDELGREAFDVITYFYPRNPGIQEVVFVLVRNYGHVGFGFRDIGSSEIAEFLKWLKVETEYASWYDAEWKDEIEDMWIGKAGEWKWPRVLFDVSDLVVDQEVGDNGIRIFNLADVTKDLGSDVGTLLAYRSFITVY